MAQKRKSFKRKHKKTSRRPIKQKHKSDPSQVLAKSILSYIFNAKEPVSAHQIFEEAEHGCKSKKELTDQVFELVRRGDLITSGKKRFRIDDKGSIFAGRLEKNHRGFGFVTDLQPKEAARFFKKDPFLSINRIGTANHGDRLLIRVKRVRKDERPEAEIITILKRSSENICGFFKTGKPPIVVPEDPRYPSVIEIVAPVDEVIEDGTVVLVQILPNPAGGGRPAGRILDVLGPPQNIDVQMRIVIEKHNLQHIFPPAVTDEAAALSFGEEDIAGRLDLRDSCHVTIDGETAKDFDDAVAVEKTRKGYRLYVSIADVSHFVRQGSPLDKEAYSRGTSIYFPGRVIPMLPEKLSNNLCSLVPHEDRLTFSAILEFDKNGKVTNKKFSKSVIRSKHRFTYTTVKEILVDKNNQVRGQHKDFLKPLQWAKELAEILYQKRMERGSIGFNIPEPEIALEDDGNIESITRKERNFAHQIIEEFMLAANESVAELFTSNKLDFIYRIHEKPSQSKVEEFTAFAKTLGIELPPPGPEPDPAWFAKVLAIVRSSPTEYVVNNLLLRTMQQARYDSDNQGHFGLAATDYTHFTSPIRRYPDLMVHRFLNSFLHNKELTTRKRQPNLKEQGEHLSSRERLAITAERDINDRLKVFFMERFIGNTFRAVISGIIESAIFVELIDLFIGGSIDIAALKDDYYLFDIKRYRFIGEISGNTFQMGDELDVVLVDVDHRLKRINFEPAGLQ